MEVIMLPLSEIFPYKDNPRINDEAVPAVAKSISEYGFRVPIVLDKEHIIICGHTRYAASKQLGLETVPCTIADIAPEKARKYRIIDNQASDIASWNLPLLEKEIEEIGDESVREYFRDGFKFYCQKDGEQDAYTYNLLFTQSEMERFRECLSALQAKYPDKQTKAGLLLAQMDEWDV